MEIRVACKRFFRLGAVNSLPHQLAGGARFGELRGAMKFRRNCASPAYSISSLCPSYRLLPIRGKCRMAVYPDLDRPTFKKSRTGCLGCSRAYGSGDDAACHRSSGSSLSFASSHEYIRGEVKDGAIVDLGISCHAADEIGELVFVELPEVGKEVSSGDAVVTLESVKSVAEVYCPFDRAEVVELNDELRDNPKLTNDDAEGKGWIVRLRIKGDPGDAARNLMQREKYDEFLKSQGGGSE